MNKHTDKRIERVRDGHCFSRDRHLAASRPAGAAEIRQHRQSISIIYRLTGSALLFFLYCVLPSFPPVLTRQHQEQQKEGEGSSSNNNNNKSFRPLRPAQILKGRSFVRLFRPRLEAAAAAVSYSQK